MIDKGVIYKSNLDMNHRLLKANSKFIELPLLLVEVIPGNYSDPKNLNFTWNCTYEDEKALHLQLYFETPHRVSFNDVSNLNLNFCRLLTN